jgi:hypothetical protein
MRFEVSSAVNVLIVFFRVVTPIVLKAYTGDLEEHASSFFRV